MLKGTKMSLESREKISKSLKGTHPHLATPRKGHKMSEETKRKIGDAHRGKKETFVISEETRKKLSAASTGRHLTEEAKRKLSLKHTGKKLSDETKAKLSNAGKGRPAWNKGKKGGTSWNKGIPCSEEIKQRISKKLTGTRFSPERIEKLCKPHGPHSQETKDKISRTRIERGIHPSEEIKKEHSEFMKKLFQNPEWAENQKKVFRMKGHTEESKRKISKSSKERWDDPEYKDRVVRKVLESSNIRPTKPELVVKELLDKYYPSQWGYNGDYSSKTVIGGLVPDFVKYDDKVVIEVFGDYYHDPVRRKGLAWHRTEEGRITTLKELGYKCLVIWEREITNPKKVLKRIEEFVA